MEDGRRKTSRVSVEGMPKNTVTVEQVEKIFGGIGPLRKNRVTGSVGVYLYMMRNIYTTEAAWPTGSAEVVYQTYQDAQRAVELLHNKQFDFGGILKCIRVHPSYNWAAISSRVCQDPCPEERDDGFEEYCLAEGRDLTKLTLKELLDEKSEWRSDWMEARLHLTEEEKVEEDARHEEIYDKMKPVHDRIRAYMQQSQEQRRKCVREFLEKRDREEGEHRQLTNETEEREVEKEREQGGEGKEGGEGGESK